MPFWKKSEDPWDLDPAKERAKQEREPLENPLDTLRECGVCMSDLEDKLVQEDVVYGNTSEDRMYSEG